MTGVQTCALPILSISAYENANSAAERRLLVNEEKQTQVWISDLLGIIPSITGKIELVYEGEQEGPYQVAMNLLDRAIRAQFITYFTNPELLKKKKNQQAGATENPYRSILSRFDKGNTLNLLFQLPDAQKLAELYKVDGLHALVKKYYKQANERETGLLMEFVLFGLATFSLISKKMVEGKIEFKDLMGSMLNLETNGASATEEEEDFS